MNIFENYLEGLKGDYNAADAKKFMTKFAQYGSQRLLKEIYMHYLSHGDYDPDIIEDTIDEIVPYLKKGAGIKGNGYSYTPNKTLTVWETSDGGKIRAKLLDIICNYAFSLDEAMDYLDDSYSAVEDLLTNARDQEEFEYNTLRGNTFITNKKPVDKYSPQDDDQTFELRIYQRQPWYGGKNITMADVKKIKVVAEKLFKTKLSGPSKDGKAYVMEFDMYHGEEDWNLLNGLHPHIAEILGTYYRKFVSVDIEKIA